MKAGDVAQATRAFVAGEVAEHAALCGGQAGDTVPPALIGALFSYLLGVHLPGPGTNYLKQSTRFRTEARVGESLAAKVEVTRLRPETRLVDLATTCLGADGRVIAEGRALVRWDGAGEGAGEGGDAGG